MQEVKLWSFCLQVETHGDYDGSSLSTENI